MAKDTTVAQRVARQAKKRKAAGWHEVRTWVPSMEDSKELRRRAAEMREAATNNSKDTA